MALAFAALIEVVTVICTGGVLFAGSMRTTGGTSEDTRSALTMFVSGTIIAGLVGASHFVGW